MVDELVVRQADGSTRRVKLSGTRIRVGRSQHLNDLVFDDDSLSRRHLVLERQGDDWIVEDLKPKNPTRLNGRVLTGRCPLRPGDRLTAGKVTLVYGEPEPVVSVDDVFLPGDLETPVSSTVVTNLEGVFARETTGERSLPGSRPGAHLPLDNPAVAALVKAGRELVGHRPLGELFRLILDLSIGAVGADRGVLMTLEDGAPEIRAVRGEGFRISATIRDRVLRERASILLRDIGADEVLRHQQSIVQQQIRSAMAVPLQTQDDVLGLIIVDSLSLKRLFGTEDLDLLTILGNVAAIRLEQERLLRADEQRRLLARDLDQAAVIQRRLLPSAAPEIPGYEIAGYNAPCRTVGGDYFDYFRYPDGRIALVVGDVSGKGMPAALLMTSLKGGVQVLAEVTDDVADLMGRLDRVVSANFPKNRFVSLVLAVLDPATGAVRYCNGGHNPPLLLRMDGTVERLEPGGTILGMLPELPYRESRTRLEPGDLLAFFSDGIVEAQNEAGEEYGEQQLARTLAACRERGAAAAIETARADVARWSAGHPPEDDITLVVVARRAILGGDAGPASRSG